MTRSASTSSAAVLILGLVMCSDLLGQTITVRTNSLVAATGARKTIYLTSSTTWTSSVSLLRYTIVDPPQHAEWSYNPSNFSYRVTYTPNDPQYTGPDQFTWNAASSIETSETTTFYIDIVSNTTPVATPKSCTVSSSVYMAALMYGSSSVVHPAADAGQPMTYVLVDTARHGTVSLNAGSGQMGYQSHDGFLGVDTFSWAVSDGISTSEPAQVTITVVGVPPAVKAQTVVAAKNTPLVIRPEYTGGYGYSCLVEKVSSPSHGTATLAGGKFTYTPATNYVGSDSFRWRVAYSNATTPLTKSLIATCSIIVKNTGPNPDWAQWRFDECRSAQTPALVPEELHLQWRRDIPSCKGAFAMGPTDIDNCRPVQMGKTLFVPVLASDSLVALDTDTGVLKWVYYASGAIRRPPVAMDFGNGTKAVIFGSDDGYVYCLNAADGAEIWKFRAAPNAKKAMGFGRLSSVWPVWASPLAYNGKIYFVAGRMPTYGLYGYCLDAATGAVVWRNDGRMLREGGNSTLGPMSFSTDHTKLYGSLDGCRPWILNPATGEVSGESSTGFGLPRWFVDGSAGYQETEPLRITAGAQVFTTTNVAPLGVSGTIGSMLVGDGKLFVTTTGGSIYCFGGSSVTPNIYLNQVTPLVTVTDVWTTVAQSIPSRNDLKQGLVLVWGVGTGRLVEELTTQATNLMIVAVDPDPVKLRNLRIKMDAAGLSGKRVSTLLGDPMDSGFAPYQAGLIVSEDLNVAGFSSGKAMVEMLYRCTRPFGGEIWLPTMNSQHSTIAGWVTTATNMPLSEVVRQTGFTGLGVDGFTQIKRTGLPDSDVALKPPYGLIAFGDSSSWSSRAMPLGVPSKGAVSGKDVYSWLPAPSAMPGYEPQPQYNNKPVTFPDKKYPMNATMYNSLYEDVEPSLYGKVFWSSACDGFFRYGNTYVSLGKTLCIGATENLPYQGILTFTEIGGCCSPSGMAGDGMMVFVPAGGKACNQRSMKIEEVGLTPMADEENWVKFRDARSMRMIQEKAIRRVGINLGAAGDWYSEDDDMLWTHHPYYGRVAEDTPLVPVTYRGNAKAVYHHSAQIYGALRAMERIGNRYRGWVSASQVTGLDGLTVHLATPLVALRTQVPPAMNGNLSDACWNGQGKVNLPFNAVGCGSECYVLLRYDDSKLYIAGSSLGSSLLAKWLKVAFNNRSVNVSTPVYQATCTGTNANGAFVAEMAIPWSTLQAAGIQKDQLVVNVDFCGAILDGDKVNLFFSPVFYDSVTGNLAGAKPHTVRLYFAEMEDKTAGQRVFDVKLQGQTVLISLDVAGETGGSRRELVKEFKDVRIASTLDVDFVRKAGEPMLSGVEIIATYSNAGSENLPPVTALEAGVRCGTVPLTTTFSAGQSYDPDGQIASYSWDMGDGTTAEGSTISHVFTAPGYYTVQVAVSDGSLVSTGSIIVTVLPMYDNWVVSHFGSTNAGNSAAKDDADGDGMSNEQEYLAGTDPLNAGSALALTDIKPEPAEGKVVLQWSSESNRWYWIGRGTNLMTGFEPIISHIPATYPLNTCTVDVGAAEDGFFVIKLEQ